MYPMYYLDAEGNRIYTLNVSRSFSEASRAECRPGRMGEVDPHAQSLLPEMTCETRGNGLRLGADTYSQPCAPRFGLPCVEGGGPHVIHVRSRRGFEAQLKLESSTVIYLRVACSSSLLTRAMRFLPHPPRILQKQTPTGEPTYSAHPARFSPDDQYSRQRNQLKKRFGIHPTQLPGFNY